MLQLIHKRSGKILVRDATALLVDEKLIRTQPERSGAFARSEYCGRGSEGPVEIALLAQQLQELGALRGFRLSRGWELGCIHELYARRCFEAARTANHKIPLHTRRPNSVQQLVGIAHHKPHGRDHRLMTREDRRQGGIVEQVSLGGSDTLADFDLLRMAGYSRDLMAAAYQLGK